MPKSTLFRKWSFLLACMFFFSTAFSQVTIHAIIFAGTTDASIGSGNQKSFDLIKNELQRIHDNNNGVGVKFYPFLGNDFQKENLTGVKEQLRNLPAGLSNDVVFFIFIGHGYNPMAAYLEYPNLVFLNTNGSEAKAEIENNSAPMKDIVQDFQALKPRLLIAYAEACNDNYLEGEEPLTFFATPGYITTAAPTSTPEEKIKDLFIDSKGLVVFTSSRPNQPSYVSSSEGGVFTQSFVRALQMETSVANAGRGSFKSLFNESEKIVKKIASDYPWSQTPQYTENLAAKPDNTDLNDPEPQKQKRGLIAWLVAKLAPNKVKKKFKKALEEGELLSLNMGIPVDDSGDRMRNKMYVKTPVMYFTSEALYWEETGDSIKALKNYGIAHYLMQNGFHTSEDKKLMKKMGDLDKQNLTGINDFGNYQKWLKNKLGIYETVFEERMEGEDDNIAESRTEINQLELEIQQNRDAIADIKSQMESIQGEIESIDVPREQTLEVKLMDMRQDSEETLKEISKTIREVKKKGVANNLASNEDEIIIGDSEAVVRFKFGKRKMNSNLRPDVKGYQLGKHCTDDIIDLTNDLMAILLARLEEVPTEKRQEIEVQLQITGNADWRGGENQLGIGYTASDLIDEEYQDLEGTTKNFYLQPGESKNITNEELAFLRAFCAWQNIKSILLDKGISPANIQVYFTAIAWPKSAIVELNGTVGEPDKRGIDISMTINNLYKHYLDKIKDLEDELEILKEEITKKEANIEDIRKRIEALEKEIADAEARKQQLETDLKKTDPRAVDSEANFLIQNVKSAWK